MYFLTSSSVLQYRVVSSKNHVTRGLDCEMCCNFSEKQACITRRQPSELLENVFVQVMLSPIANDKPIFILNKHIASLNQYYAYICNWKGLEMILFDSTTLSV